MSQTRAQHIAIIAFSYGGVVVNSLVRMCIRFNEKISQDTQDQRPLTCDLNTKEIEKQLNYGNTTNCERSMLFNRLLKLSEDGASTTYSGNIFQISQTRLQKKYLWAFTLDWCLYSLYL